MEDLYNKVPEADDQSLEDIAYESCSDSGCEVAWLFESSPPQTVAESNLRDEDAISIRSSQTLSSTSSRTQSPSSPRTLSPTPSSTAVDWEERESGHLDHDIDHHSNDSEERKNCSRCLIASLEDQISHFKAETLDLRLSFAALSTCDDEADVTPDSPAPIQPTPETAPRHISKNSDIDIHSSIGDTPASQVATLRLRSHPSKFASPSDNEKSNMQPSLSVSEVHAQSKGMKDNIRESLPNDNATLVRNTSSRLTRFLLIAVPTFILFFMIMLIWVLAGVLILKSVMDDLLEDEHAAYI
ncbi:hypothetical protein ABW21_db0203341 [Orbilia brochopaga]|nr:hypothetical protein ABW21_db0203341 [Drechslerella brochopaga]